ncbi:MAG: hypothetical protein R3242_10605 [Akkermansiaceae bacterium]|nr:hypothetical protein [Akkermansiaceae bacterium]
MIRNAIVLTALTTFLALLSPPAAHAHPDHDTKPGEPPTAPILTGNGQWTYEVVPGWGELPEGKELGPTHGTVLVDKDGTVYFCTNSKESIIVWKEDGSYLRSIAPEAQGFHAMDLRTEDGKTVIYGAQNNGYGNKIRTKEGLDPMPLRVLKLDTDGKILLTIPNEKTAEIEKGWGGLTAVTVAPDGSIFAAMGYGSNLIHKFDPEGRHLLTFGGPGKEDGKFRTCHGLTIDKRFGEPRLLVADRENRRLVHFDLEGKFIGTHATHLRRPCSFSWHGEHLGVAELEGRCVILDKTGTPLAFLGDQPNPKKRANFKVPSSEQVPGIFTAPHGLGFAPNGDLYVQDWNIDGRVTKLKLRK